MSLRSNDSTINRPWGERPIDAPIVPIDIHGFTQQLMEEKAWQGSDRNAITVFKTDHLTVVISALHKGAEMKPGNVEGTGVMTLQILDGQVQFNANNDNIELGRGQMVVLHEHIPYTATALEETVCLITMAK